MPVFSNLVVTVVYPNPILFNKKYKLPPFDVLVYEGVEVSFVSVNME